VTVSGFDSSLDRTFDVIGAELRIWARARYSEIVDQTKGHPESPIEEALLAGMIAVNIFKPFFEFDGSESPVPRVGHSFIRLQHRIGPYRVDFLARSGSATAMPVPSSSSATARAGIRTRPRTRTATVT
jgi:hypothetical protein